MKAKLLPGDLDSLALRSGCEAVTQGTIPTRPHGLRQPLSSAMFTMPRLERPLCRAPPFRHALSQVRMLPQVPAGTGQKPASHRSASPGCSGRRGHGQPFAPTRPMGFHRKSLDRLRVPGFCSGWVRGAPSLTPCLGSRALGVRTGAGIRTQVQGPGTPDPDLGSRSSGENFPRTRTTGSRQPAPEQELQ